ncbi:hypothetical protein [Saccharospirillum alexandrii]|uniref:hypothetical protein n=1 Tax=Saccharospirillum alexandrii TaxID=2448477 RepID=UPI000FD7636F|nr:hypothetical protein [Saccharospirillum alexandrii]
MTAPRSIAPTLHTGHSARVVDRCEAIVLETHESRCTKLSINGQTVAVPPEKAGRNLVRVDDLVMADLMDDGTARVAYVVSTGDNEFIPHISTLGDLAQWVLPEHIARLLTEVGGSAVEIGQQGVDVKAPRATVTAETQLELNGKNIRTEAEELCVVQGREIHLN